MSLILSDSVSVYQSFLSETICLRSNLSVISSDISPGYWLVSRKLSVCRRTWSICRSLLAAHSVASHSNFLMPSLTASPTRSGTVKPRYKHMARCPKSHPLIEISTHRTTFEWCSAASPSESHPYIETSTRCVCLYRGLTVSHCPLRTVQCNRVCHASTCHISPR